MAEAKTVNTLIDQSKWKMRELRRQLESKTLPKFLSWDFQQKQKQEMEELSLAGKRTEPIFDSSSVNSIQQGIKFGQTFKSLENQTYINEKNKLQK